MGESASRRRDGMSDQALIEGTGVDWATWLALLDERDATSLDHAAIADLLIKEFDIDGWWAQSITVGYEQERGMREPGQRADGTVSAGASKTVDADAATAFDASDGTRVYVTIVPKGEYRAAVQVEAAMLASADDAATAKAAWQQRLARLAAALPH